MSNSRRGLQLTPDINVGINQQHPILAKNSRDSSAMILPIRKLLADETQARKSFDAEKLAELAASIKEHGVLQPLLVLQEGNLFRIVAGERRFRAAKLAGLKELPARIIEQDDRAQEIQLIENLQRDDLLPLEEAEALKMLKDSLSISIRALATRLGKSKSYIDRRLQLLDMPEDVQNMVAQDPSSLSKAAVVAKVKDDSKRQKQIAEVKTRGVLPSKGRAKSLFKFSKKKQGGFDLAVSFRPEEHSKTELIEKLQHLISELEKN